MLFSALGSENKIIQTDAIVIKLNSSGPYIYKTSVTINAYTVCSSSASKEFSVGKELGKTQIEITLVGEQIAMLVTWVQYIKAIKILIQILFH